jgi:vacuolar-type H+-ATPase subunit I/STV1
MIVRMKKAHLVVLKEDKERQLQSLQKYGELMLINTAEEGEIRENADFSQQLQRIDKTLHDLKPYLEDKKHDDLIIPYDDFIKNDPKRQELLEKIEHTNEEITRIQGENNSLNETMKFLQPWKDLNVRLSEMTAPKYAILHTGFVELRNIKNIVLLLKDYGCELELLGRANEGQALMFAAYYKDNDEILDKIKNFGYSELSLPAENLFVGELLDASRQQRVQLSAKLLIASTDG